MNRYPSERLDPSQIAVNHMNRNGAFADCRRDSFHVPGSHISHREYTRQAGFEHLRRAFQRPPRSFRIAVKCLHIPPRKNESFVVQGEAPLQPFGPGQSARHDEHVLDRVSRDLARYTILPLHSLQSLFSFERDNLSLHVQFDKRVFDQPLYEIARHGAAQLAGPHEQMNLACRLRKKRGGLSLRSFHRRQQ